MIREVLQYPDERLRAVAAPVEAVTDAVRELADDLIHTMRHGSRYAVGLAAPQIGVALRVFVMEEMLNGGRPKSHICINLKKQSPVTKQGEQPWYFEPVPRTLLSAQAARKWQALAAFVEGDSELAKLVLHCNRDPKLVYTWEA